MRLDSSPVKLLKVALAFVFMGVVVLGAIVGFAIAEGGLHDATKWEWARGIILKERTPARLGGTGADASLKISVKELECVPKGVAETCTAKVEAQRTEEGEVKLEPDLQYLHLDDIVVGANEVTPSEAVGSAPQQKTIVWRDVPRGGVLYVELHESLLSGGILIDVRPSER
jgi:hypothetical protein